MKNLAADQPTDVARMEKLLLLQIPYPQVTMEVAQYNLDMARWWVKNEPMWKCIVNGTCFDPAGGRSRSDLGAGGNCQPTRPGGQSNCWADLWQRGPKGYWKAWNEWIQTAEPVITPCLSTLEYNWPPKDDDA